MWAEIGYGVHLLAVMNRDVKYVDMCIMDVRWFVEMKRVWELFCAKGGCC
jgi:hypothetical protein